MKYWRRNFVAMTQHELDTIIQSGEGYKTEFKRNVNTDLSKELAAFANSSGGKVFVGIEDNGAISGVTIDNALRSKVTMMAHECDPPVNIELEYCNNVLIVNVPEGKNKPYRCTNGFYIRNGASSIKLSTREIIDFIQSEGKVKFDELTNKAAKYPEELNDLAIARYKQLSGIIADITDDELLTNLGLVHYEEPAPVINNTGVLFFIQNPTQYIAQSAVTCVAYKGNTKVDILDKKTFDLDIITNIDDAITFLKRHLNVSYEIKEKQRKEKLEIPEVVLREAVVNAVAHRDYFEKGANVMIEVFDNRVEISNPGGLPKGLKPEDFGKRTLARNPLIAALLNRAKYIEKLGTGVQRIRYEMAAAGLPAPDFHFDGFFTIMTQRYNFKELLKNELQLNDKRNERMAFILRQLAAGTFNVDQAAIELQTTSRTIRNDLDVLAHKAWIKSTGATKGRDYELTDIGKEKLAK
jgi:ATP-dependent DNA helicase RecG